MIANDVPANDLEKVQMLESILIAHATGSQESNLHYQELRKQLSKSQDIRGRLPSFVRTNRSLDTFWGWVKGQADTYAERRTLISRGFNELIDYLEDANQHPIDDHASDILSSLSVDEINRIWQKSLQRRENDPEGAITLARTLLESTCKQILDSCGITYSEKDDLNSLYKRTAKQLNLSPDQHTEEAFKSILGGAFSMVNGLETLRNRLSDSHGRGGSRAKIRPSARHASLAVNIAGTVATFLVETSHSKNIDE